MVVMEVSKDIEELFEKKIKEFPKIKDKIMLDGRKKEMSNWKSKQKQLSARREVAKGQKE